jgi:hypothetical protein
MAKIAGYHGNDATPGNHGNNTIYHIITNVTPPGYRSLATTLFYRVDHSILPWQSNQVINAITPGHNGYQTMLPGQLRYVINKHGNHGILPQQHARLQWRP